METKNKTYNGWINHETWVVNWWMNNEYESQIYYGALAKKITDPSMLADRLASEFKNQAPELDGVYSDLLRAAISDIFWYEIAEGLIDANGSYRE